MTDLALIFARDLASLRQEILAYPDDDSLWALPKGAPNSGGTLVLHLCGNLRHFIGAGLGGSGYVRDRDTEFGARGLPRDALVALVDATATEVALALLNVSPAQLEAPVKIGNIHLPARRGLLHLAVHLTYHLGQLDYHRRIVTGDSLGVGALGVAELVG